MSKTAVDPNHIEKLKIWASSVREKSSFESSLVDTNVDNDNQVDTQLPPHTLLSHPLTTLSNTLSTYCSIF